MERTGLTCRTVMMLAALRLTISVGEIRTTPCRTNVGRLSGTFISVSSNEPLPTPVPFADGAARHAEQNHEYTGDQVTPA